jgi:hypothetical protein
MKKTINKSYDSTFGNKLGDRLLITVSDLGNFIVEPEISTSQIKKKVFDPIVGESSISIDLYKPNFFTKKFGSDLYFGIELSEFLKDVGAGVGSHTISFTPLTKIYDTEFIITQISESGTELELIGETNDSTSSFILNKIPFRFIEPFYIELINNYSFIEQFYSYYDTRPDIKSEILRNNSLSTDQSLAFYLYDIFVGVKRGDRGSTGVVQPAEIISIRDNVNFILYGYYDSPFAINDILPTIKDKILECVKFELSKTGTNSSDIISSISDFYFAIFTDVLRRVENYTEDNFFSPFRSSILIGQDYRQITAKKEFTSPDGRVSIFIKLSSAIDSNVLGNSVFFGSVEYESILTQNIFVYNNSSPTTNKLRPPSFSPQNSYGSSGFEVEDVKNANISVDYDNFENFVIFSSVESRIEIFKRKLSIINGLKSIIDNPAVDPLTANQSTSELNAVLLGMDGYEKFLLENPTKIYEHTKENRHVNYDLSNSNSLSNNTPVSVRENVNNEEYIRYIKMVGHVVDNLWIYIENFPTTDLFKNNSPSISKEILNSLGWDISTVKNVSHVPWDRLIQTISEILRRKGSLTSVKELLNVYGVPPNLLSIKEFSGGDVLKTSFYKDYIKFSPSIKSKYEYIEVPLSTDTKDIQFSFSIDRNDKYTTGNVIRLCQSDGKWALDLFKGVGIYYNLIFTIKDENHSDLIAEIRRCPVGNLSRFDVLISKVKLPQDTFGNVYVRIMNRVGGELTFDSSTSVSMTEAGPDSFTSDSSSANFGNYNVDHGRTKFEGIIDEIKVWTNNLTDEEVTSHAITYDSFSIKDLGKCMSCLFSRMYFPLPENLYSEYGNVVIKNKSLSGLPTGDIIFHNFRNVSEYPFQFKRDIVEQEYNLYNGLNFSGGYTKPSILKPVKSPALSPYINYPTSKTQGLLNKIGVFYSPTEQSNEELLKMISNIEIGDYLMEPTLDKLKYLIRSNISSIGIKENVNTGIARMKRFIEPSIFDQIRDLTAEKSKLVSGILIEQSPLERIRISGLSPIIDLHNNLSVVVSTNIKVESNANGAVVGELPVEFSTNRTDSSSTSSYFGETSSAFDYIQPYEIGPFKGYAQINGVDYVIKNINGKLNYIKLKTANTLGAKNIKLNGKFLGNYVEISPESYELDGEFSGEIYFQEYDSSITVQKNVKIKGNFFGSFFDNFVFSTSYSLLEIYSDGDIYDDIRRHSTGIAKNQIVMLDRINKFLEVGGDGANIRPYRTRTRIIRRGGGDVYATLSSSTTVSKAGLPDGSPPFTSKFVDRGTVTNIISM